MIIAADNLQITNPTIMTAVKEMNPEPIRHLIKRCLSAGAQAIDINSGPLTHAPEEKMMFLVETVQELTSIPLLLDSINPRAIEAGLKISRNPVIINGFSMEPQKMERILPLAVKYDADLIGYLLYPDGMVPFDPEDRYQLAVDLFTATSQAGLDPKRLIIDPVVAPVIWDNGIAQNRDLIELMRHLPELLDYPVRTIAGLSNLTTGRGPCMHKIVLENAFLPMLAASGLSIVLMNILHRSTVQIARACQSLIEPGIFTWEAFSNQG